MLGWWMLATVLAAGPTERDPAPHPAAYELAWTAPAGCPSAEQVQARIARLAADPRDGQGVMFVEATVTESAAGYSLTLRTEYRERVDARTVESAVCEDLGESTALVVAVALEPALGDEPDAGDPVANSPAPPELPPPPTGETPPEERVIDPTRAGTDVAAADTRDSAPVAPAHREGPSRTRRPLPSPDRIVLRIAPHAEIGGIPRVGAGAELAVGLLWPRLRLELRGGYLFPRRADAPGEGRALYQLGTAGARGCARPRAGRLELPVCLGFEGGVLRADSRDTGSDRTVTGPWLGPSALAGLAFAGDRVGLWTFAEVAVAALSTRVLVGPDVAFRALPVSVRVGAGLEIFFSIHSRRGGQRG